MGRLIKPTTKNLQLLSAILLSIGVGLTWPSQTSEADPARRAAQQRDRIRSVGPRQQQQRERQQRTLQRNQARLDLQRRRVEAPQRLHNQRYNLQYRQLEQELLLPLDTEAESIELKQQQNRLDQIQLQVDSTQE